MSLATPEKIRILQRKLYEKAKKDDTRSLGEGHNGSMLKRFLPAKDYLAAEV